MGEGAKNVMRQLYKLNYNFSSSERSKVISKLDIDDLTPIEQLVNYMFIIFYFSYHKACTNIAFKD